ncbi:hypothetical protein [Aureimonas sp. D3]|uniref:hypothetical protein n=1 Tax=Aureimonas sp. D3 TaxID=1638164 RepID=UPI00078375D8|nr:hypothetical protein [Aureimonas sp. D3]
MAQERQRAAKRNRGDDGDATNHSRERRRPQYLFSGLTRFGCCGSGHSMISADLVACSMARNNGI